MSYIKSYSIICLLTLCLFGCKTKQLATTSTTNKVYFKSLDEAKNFVKNGGDINYAESKYGWTALILVAQEGNYELATYLISKGADVNKVSTDKEVSPLNRAASEGHLKLVKLFLKQGADINHQDVLGSTALMRAAYGGHTAVVQELISNKALIDVRANRGESAIFLAVAKEQVEVVELLLAYGANTERPTVFEETPMSKAKALNNNTLIALLSIKPKK